MGAQAPVTNQSSQPVAKRAAEVEPEAVVTGLSGPWPDVREGLRAFIGRTLKIAVDFFWSSVEYPITVTLDSAGIISSIRSREDAAPGVLKWDITAIHV
jgi:hypothetical protein